MLDVLESMSKQVHLLSCQLFENGGDMFLILGSYSWDSIDEVN